MVVLIKKMDDTKWCSLVEQMIPRLLTKWSLLNTKSRLQTMLINYLMGDRQDFQKPGLQGGQIPQIKGKCQNQPEEIQLPRNSCQVKNMFKIWNQKVLICLISHHAVSLTFKCFFQVFIHHKFYSCRSVKYDPNCFKTRSRWKRESFWRVKVTWSILHNILLYLVYCASLKILKVIIYSILFTSIWH